MTLRSLEIFVTVAKYGKMSEAASKLYLSQPTISQAITELEKEYGVLLFERLSKKLYITEAGKQFLVYAQNILNMSKELGKCMSDLSSNKSISLGATSTIGNSILVDLVGKFEENNPNTKINVTIDNTQVIENMILNGQIDIAFVEGSVKSKEINIINMMVDCLVLLCSRDHPLSNREVINIQELADYPFVLREEGSGTRKAFENELDKNNVAINVKWNCRDFDSILAAVLAGQGLTVISKRLAKPYIESGQLLIVPIKDVEMKRNFSLIYHKNKFISDSLMDFIDFVIKR